MPALLMQIVNEEPPPLAERYSPPLRAIVAALLTKDVTRRRGLDEALARPLAARAAYFNSGHLRGGGAARGGERSRRWA